MTENGPDHGLLVFGAGALGSLVAARLSEYQHHRVALVGRGDHVSAIRSRGLRVSGKSELVARLEAVETADALSFRPETILVTVKSFDTDSAMRSLEPFWGTATFVSLQNGLGNEETMASHAEKVLGAVINQGVTFTGPGVVYHAGEGETELGPFAGTGLEDAERVAAGFRAAGLPASVFAEIRPRLWRKAILNAAVNPLTALLGKRTGELVENPELVAVIESVIAESVAIAAARGMELDGEELLGLVRRVAAATRDNKSSMLQDLEKGRPTEIEAINGALVRAAGSAGLASPLNSLLARLVRAAQGARPR